MPQPESPLDDEDYPAIATGQAARMLGVQQAFLRSLDDAGTVSPQRSAGGHRRYSRRQLRLVLRIRAELDDGHTLAAAARITDLQDRLSEAQDELGQVRDQLADTRGQLDAARDELDSRGQAP